jgi:hypothetical protein
VPVNAFITNEGTLYNINKLCWVELFCYVSEHIGQLAGTCGYGEELSGSINAENILTSCKVYCLASQEGTCSME